MLSLRRVAVVSSLIAVLFIFGVPATASAASYTLTADKETFVIGDTFHVDVRIDSTDVGVNAAQATITFPKNIVQVTGIDKSTSAFDFWLQGPSYSNDTGQVTFIGGSQSGLSGKSLEVARITFTVKGAGAVSIIFSDGAVTASDGSGTNVLTSMNGLQLTSITTQNATLIKPPQIVRSAVPTGVLPVKPGLAVPLFPDPTAWYPYISKFIVHWSLPKDVTDVATAINRDPAFQPTVSEGLFDNKSFGPLTDGIWYLHVRFKNSVGWGPTAQYRIGIDSTPPLSFSVSSPDGLSTANVAPAIHFVTKDQPSGIRDYKVIVDGVVATTTVLTAYTLPPQAPGKHDILVQALDQAGNSAESRLTIEILEAPLITIAGIRITQFSFYATIIIFLIVGLLLGRYTGRIEHQRRRRRIIIAQRDIQAAFNLIRKDLDSLGMACDKETPRKDDAKEICAVLHRVTETVEKFEKYATQNIEEID
ncbi:MAG: cohesin domain-containing protein [Minisyncoccota bacterium]